MATNANANGIPFLKRTGIPPAIKNSMVVYYDIKKQGCTNENMKANPVLKDFSGNGNDGQCNGFAWNCESGIGEFVFKKFITNDNISVKENILTFNITPDIFTIQNNVGYKNITFNTPAVKVKITGIKDGIKGLYYYRNSEGIEKTVTFIKDGIYNLPKSFNTVQNDAPNAGTSTGIRFDNPNKATAVITIEQLDYYKDAICTDGVDDYIYEELLRINNVGFRRGTIIFDADFADEERKAGIVITNLFDIYNHNTCLKTYVINYDDYTIHSKDIIAITTDDDFYKNNMEVYRQETPDTISYGNHKLYIGGGNPENNNYTKMYLRRIAVFNRVLTADEIKYVYEKIFGCKLKTMEERVEDSIILYYDVAKQGATNESMKSYPRLIDLSGHGYDAKLYNFAWTENSGINTTTYPNALVSDGVDDYGLVEGLPLLVKEVGYTVIAKRKLLDFPFTAIKGFIGKRTSIVDNGNKSNKGAFIIEKYSEEERPLISWNFCRANDITIDNENYITYQTSKTYNNQILEKGFADDINKMSIFAAYINIGNNEVAERCSAALYSLMLFNRDLTTEEIEFVKQKYFSD